MGECGPDIIDKTTVKNCYCNKHKHKYDELVVKVKFDQ